MVIGWALSTSIDTNMVLKALNRARINCIVLCWKELDNYKRALKNFKNLQKIICVTYVRYYIALCYHNSGEYEKAIPNYEISYGIKNLMEMVQMDMDKDMYKFIKDTIKETQDLLLKNSEWINRYKDYADMLLANIDMIKLNRSRFNQFPPLYFYISTTNAKNVNSTLLLDVRYRGQSVATLKTKNNKITISTKQQYDNNKRDFDCNIELKDIAWREKEVSEFRTFFKIRPNSRNNIGNKKNEEHNMVLLTK